MKYVRRIHISELLNKPKIQTSSIINSFTTHARFDMLKYLELVNDIEMKKLGFFYALFITMYILYINIIYC